jgi:AraC-like DNA-binding protein
VLNRHAAELLEKLPQENGIVDGVRRALAESLRGGDASISAVSKRLGMSARTLQRKLSDLGTSHQELLDDMRRDLSRKYLQESGMAICEVAFLLGFSDTSVFHRAFRRWTGETPGEYQKRVSSDL